MANLSVRVPEELQRKLDRESSSSRRPRSDLIREAIAEYVTRRERERELSVMEKAARAMASAGGDRRPSADEFLEIDLEALELGEGGRPQLWREFEPIRSRLAARDALREDCHAMVEHVRSLDRGRLRQGPLTTVTPDEMAAVERSLRVVLGLS